MSKIIGFQCDFCDNTDSTSIMYAIVSGPPTNNVRYTSLIDDLQSAKIHICKGCRVELQMQPVDPFPKEEP